MGFILDSLANILVEALDTLVLWICNLSVTFHLDIGETDSVFSSVFPSSVTGKVKGGSNTIAIEDFATAIGALAVMLLLLVTIFKIYQLMINPNAKSESPGEIVIKFVLSLTGIVMSYPIFKYLQKGFNVAYGAFTQPYNRITRVFKYKNFLALKEAEEISKSLGENDSNVVEKAATAIVSSNAKDRFLFGSDHLINKNDGIMQHPFALAIIEIFVGIALMMALIKLMFEIYERYVILAVLYLFSPLAFMSLVTKGGEVFKSYWWMVFCQFILMCSNLVFLTVFMAAWYKKLQEGVNMDGDGYFFESSQKFITFMLLLISWLIVGQKFDELLKGLGLNAATTGQGIMGAALGSVIVARALMGGATAAAGHTGKFLTGQTGTQRAISAGMKTKGKEGGLVGKMAYGASKGASAVSDKIKGSAGEKLPKAVEGKDMNDALNNMVKGTDEKGGLNAKPLDSKPGARQNFNAANLSWSETEKGSGIYQAYDENTNTTFTMGATNQANTTMQNNYGEKVGKDGSHHKGELGRISYTNGAGVKQDRLIHISQGRSVGEMPERSLAPEAPTPKASTSAGGSGGNAK